MQPRICGHLKYLLSKLSQLAGLWLLRLAKLTRACPAASHLAHGFLRRLFPRHAFALNP